MLPVAHGWRKQEGFVSENGKVGREGGGERGREVGGKGVDNRGKIDMLKQSVQCTMCTEQEDRHASVHCALEVLIPGETKQPNRYYREITTFPLLLADPQ